MTAGHRVLLAGDASARPAGLERALTRAGFLLSETPSADGGPEPDAVLVTVACAGEAGLRAAIGAGGGSFPPVVVLIASADPDGPAAAMAVGADDALAAPAHLPELCARLHARIRDRQCPRGTAREGAVRRSLEGLVADGRLSLRPDEVVLALVRRLARAFDLHACSFVAVEADGGARVVAEAGQDLVSLESDGALDPADHPELAEAIRGRRTAVRADGAVTAVPALAGARVHGVLLLRRRGGQPLLSPAQLQFAGTLAEAAARALDAAVAPGNGNGATAHPRAAPAEESLDRRLQEEFERARRYSLSFSLVLLEVRPPNGNGDGAADTGERLRRGFRMPDFVARYGGGEFAVVMPETGAEGARRSVARVREQLTRGGSDGGEPPFSAGIVTYPHPAASQPDDLFALVEAALARGKAQDGERVGVAD
jgi:diguanylate cyclase (GGDEF)-like protein